MFESYLFFLVGAGIDLGNFGMLFRVSRKSKPNKQSASHLSRTQKSCSYDFGPMTTDRRTTPFTTLGKPFAALSFLRHDYRSSLWVCLKSSKIIKLRHETLAPQSQTALFFFSQIFFSIKTLRGSTTELRLILVCGPFLSLLSARRPAGVDLFSLNYLTLGRGTYDGGVQFSSN